MKIYIYKLNLIDRLLTKEQWTEKDNAILERHIAHFDRMMKEGTLLLAGKTEGLDETTYGLCLFMANNYNDAVTIMECDPAISEGIMTGCLHEYSLSFFNKDFQ